MEEDLYAERDLIDLDGEGHFYSRHVRHMTSEGLHEKSDIAAELGQRDYTIVQLRSRLAAADKVVVAARELVHEVEMCDGTVHADDVHATKEALAVYDKGVGE